MGVEPTGGQQSFMRAGFADPRPRRDPFTDLMGVTGNTITMLTLVMVALCWPYAWGPVLAITRAERARSADSPGRRMPAAALAFPVLVAGNLGGLYSAAAMWRILTS